MAGEKNQQFLNLLIENGLENQIDQENKIRPLLNEWFN